MSQKTKTPRISLISQIWKILIREIRAIRGDFDLPFLWIQLVAADSNQSNVKRLLTHCTG
jgi:hypothetical protein